MKIVETVTVDIGKVRPYDMVIARDGHALPVPLLAVRVTLEKDGHPIVRLPNTEGGTERRLYGDQVHQVTVERTHIVPDVWGELHLDADDWGVTSDALMLLAEQHEREGKPSGQIRAALQQWQHFVDSPSARVDVVIRRKPEGSNVDAAGGDIRDMKLADMHFLTVRTFNALRRSLGSEVVTVGDLCRIPDSYFNGSGWDDLAKTVRDLRAQVPDVKPAEFAQPAEPGPRSYDVAWNPWVRVGAHTACSAAATRTSDFQGVQHEIEGLRYTLRLSRAKDSTRAVTLYEGGEVGGGFYPAEHSLSALGSAADAKKRAREWATPIIAARVKELFGGDDPAGALRDAIRAQFPGELPHRIVFGYVLGDGYVVDTVWTHDDRALWRRVDTHDYPFDRLLRAAIEVGQIHYDAKSHILRAEG